MRFTALNVIHEVFDITVTLTAHVMFSEWMDEMKFYYTHFIPN